MSTQVNIGWAYNDPNNNKYYLTVATSITQMLLKSNPDNFYNIYIITDRNDDFDIIKYLYKGNNYKITKSTPKGLEYLGDYDKVQYKEKKWSSAMFWKQMFPLTFTELDKILVCDPDILFNGDIAKFWEEVDTGEYHMVGNHQLRVPVLEKPGDDPYWKMEYNIMLHLRSDYEQIKEKTKKWMNGGFFLANLKKIREDKCYEDWKKSLEYLVSRPNDSFSDEDMVYLSDKTKIGFIDYEWNYQVCNTICLCEYYWIFRDIDKVKELAKNALTFHFGDPKPWNYSQQLNSPGMFEREVLGISFDFTLYNHEVFKEYKNIYDKLALYSTL